MQGNGKQKGIRFMNELIELVSETMGSSGMLTIAYVFVSILVVIMAIVAGVMKIHYHGSLCKSEQDAYFVKPHRCRGRTIRP